MRLTSDKKVSEMGMAELAHNSCYTESGKARYRDYEMDMDARTMARILSITLAGEKLPESDMRFDEEILGNLQYCCFTDIRGLIALSYRNLWAMADLREKLKHYEDAEEQGLLVMLECHSESDEGTLTIVECHCEECTCGIYKEECNQTVYCERYERFVQKKGFCSHARKRAAEQENTGINAECENETVLVETETEAVENDTEKVVEAAEMQNAEPDGRLTESDELGNWGVKGLLWKNLYVGQTITREIHDKLYGCLCKLKDYENTGLSPEEVERLQEDR